MHTHTDTYTHTQTDTHLHTNITKKTIQSQKVQINYMLHFVYVYNTVSRFLNVSLIMRIIPVKSTHLLETTRMYNYD